MFAGTRFDYAPDGFGCELETVLRESELYCRVAGCFEVGPSRDVCFGLKADMCSAQAHVRFTPESDMARGICISKKPQAFARGLRFPK